MKRLAEGHQEAFHEIYRRYSAHVLGYCRRILHDHSVSDEISQEVWIKVVRAAASYRSEGTLKSWLLTVTRRTALNYLRDSRAGMEVATEDVEDSTSGREELRRTDFEDRIFARAAVEEIRRRIDELPANQRLALTLWLTEDLSYQEIAQEMDLTESAVKSLIHRARATLEQDLRGVG